MKTYRDSAFALRVAGLLLGALVAAAPASATDVTNARSADAPLVAERIEPYQLPDRVVGGPGASDRMLPAPRDTRSMHLLDEVLDRVSADYGHLAAASAAYDLECARRR